MRRGLCLRCIAVRRFRGWYHFSPSNSARLLDMSEITHILSEIDAGDPSAAERLLPLVYSELRKLAAGHMAREKPGHTLEATALVHEAYVRLVGPADDRRWENRGHFFAAAAEAMRRILVDSARRKGRAARRRPETSGVAGGARRGGTQRTGSCRDQ